MHLRRGEIMLVATVAMLLFGGGAILIAESSAQRSAPPVLTVLSPSPTPTRGDRRVVVIGDSVATGSHCDCTAYGQLVANELAHADGRRTTTTNLAKAGATTSSVLSELSQPAVMARLRGAEVVIVTVGANDFEQSQQLDCGPGVSMACYALSLETLSDRIAQILSRIQSLSGAQRSRVVVTGYWNVFLDGQVGRSHGVAYVRDSVELTQRVNSIIATQVAAFQGVYVDLYSAFRGDNDADDTALLAADGDHPNAAGQTVIARAITHGLAAAPSMHSQP